MSFRPGSSPLGEHLWQWTDPEDPSASELVLLRHVSAKDLPGEPISKARLMLDSDAPFASYTEYLMCMAAFSPEFSADMAKGKTLLGVVKAACTYSRWGSYMNNCHMRTHVPGGRAALQPVGSTPNEALGVKKKTDFCSRLGHSAQNRPRRASPNFGPSGFFFSFFFFSFFPFLFVFIFIFLFFPF